MDNVNPLNEQHFQNIEKALADCATARARIKLASMAGIDVTAQERVLDESEAKLRQIKQVYFPGR